jgi:hypothetical protein
MDPVSKLEGFGMKALHFLTVSKEKQSLCIAILASLAGQNIDIVVLAQPFRVSEGIPVSESGGRIIHQSLPDELAKSKRKCAYLTNSGLDLKDIKGSEKSYLFEQPGEVFYRLGFGEKFRLPLVCVKLEELKSEGRDLNSILEGRTSLFSRYLEKSSFPDLLRLPGQYTAFILDDVTLKKLFGQNIPDKKVVNMIVLKALVSGLGTSDSSNSDSRVNMLGEPVLFKKGIPVLGDHEVKVLKKGKYSNGTGMIIHTSNIGKLPDMIDLKQAEETYRRLIEKYEALISMEEVSRMITSLAETLSVIVKKQMKEFSDNVEMLKRWSVGIYKSNQELSSKEVAESIAIGVLMAPVFKQIRDH